MTVDSKGASELARPVCAGGEALAAPFCVLLCCYFSVDCFYFCLLFNFFFIFFKLFVLIFSVISLSLDTF